MERVVRLVVASMRTQYASTRPALRGQHPKTHGCVRAEFAIDAQVPSDLRHGIFATPTTYEAWIRFSSSAVPPKPDFRRDAQGMSIKLLGVPGRKVLEGESRASTQDFVLVNHDVFFCRDAVQYADFAEWISRPGRSSGRVGTALRTGAFFFPSMRPSTWQTHPALNLVRVIHQRVTNPLRIRYWSQTPYLLGTGLAVKYSARPQPSTNLPPPRQDSADRLATAMAQTLESHDVFLDFLVQRQLDPRTMPIEDATVTWGEDPSPFDKVATIRIPVQDCGSQARRSYAEGLRFTPWHALPAHRPLGGINRVRRAVYIESAKVREELNGPLPPEP
jgi:hypothetical protein